MFTQYPQKKKKKKRMLAMISAKLMSKPRGLGIIRSNATYLTGRRVHEEATLHCRDTWRGTC